MTETLTDLFRAWPEQMSFRQNVINSMRSQPRASLSGYLSHTYIHFSCVKGVSSRRESWEISTDTHTQACNSSKQSVVSPNLLRMYLHGVESQSAADGSGMAVP